MDDSERLKRLSIRVVLLEHRLDDLARLESRSYEANRRLDDLERQRDAAQGAATVPDTSAREGAQEDRCAQPPPASSTRDEIATLLWDHVAVMPGRYGWLNAADAVLAMEAGWRKEIEYLRAQLAEREAELAALKSSERARRAKETT